MNNEQLNATHFSRMKVPLLALLSSVTYATVRYQVFKGVPWHDWPAYTLNKAFGLAALLLMVLSVIRKPSTQERPVADTSYMAGVFAVTHVFLSLILLSPAYYESFFRENKLTVAAGFSMLLGTLAAVTMALGPGNRPGQSAVRSAKNLSALAFIVGLHAALQGFTGWFAPSKWPGMMPPITLISFLLGLAAVFVAVRKKIC
jgi:hypothetical protein